MTTPTADQRARWENAHRRYLRAVDNVAYRLREMADDVERRGRGYGSHLFNQSLYLNPASDVVTTATGIHNLHLGEVVRLAAEAQEAHHPHFGDPSVLTLETP